MASYGFLMAAWTFDALQLGLIGWRGRIVLALIGAGLVTAVLVDVITKALTGHHDLTGYLGVAGGVATVLGGRRLVRWLDEGGWHVLALVAVEVGRWCGEVVVAFVDGLRSPRDYVQEVVVHAEPVVSGTGVIRVATAQEMRWSVPHGDYVALLDGTDDTGGDTGVALVHEGLHSVETYSDWLPGAVEKCGGFNAAAREAASKWQVSRSTFVRDMRKLRDAA